MKKTILLSAFISTAILSGCSSTVNEDIVKQQMALEQQRLELEQQKLEIAQEKREEEIDAIPKWALAPPQSDGSGFYAVGISESNKLSFAMKKAKMQAEFELAKQYKQLLSGSERSFEKENDKGEIQSQTEILIDKIIDEVPIVGYDVVKQEVKAQQGKHVAYILLKMPYEQYNKVLQEQKQDSTEASVVKAFDDFERRLNNRRAQEKEKQEIKHQQKIETEATRNKQLNSISPSS
ncbi:hypothetical protein [Colwellia sp. BRX8-9]|jgi:hypothetical protein|uniref:hypothetical protein n=1 Tax=Colwellia sp. BRX8-9 TaxID=2759831 RepID=UPI0015F558FF|nr:hypothetical protein [Colwellia sp. BRX8-9]MBA6348810.1 hypothetical protein [Colwellia sp. BRX8-9]